VHDIKHHLYSETSQAACALVAGDSVLGYDLEHANLADPDLDKWIARGGSPPDVILVRELRPSQHLCTITTCALHINLELRCRCS
jgi:hypothetical protein